MGKYEPLKEFLRKQSVNEVQMTFVQIERVIDAKLPPRAQHHRAWWSNSPSNNVMTKIWLDAGYRSERVDMSARKLVFKRSNVAKGVGAMAESPRDYQAKQDAPKGRHPLIGALKGTFW